MSETRQDERPSLTLTAHPLQRVGAYALAFLAKAPSPELLSAEGFGEAVETMTKHAVGAALVRDTKSERGFWLKASMSFFPNSKMNHPSNAKKDDAEIRDAVRLWRRKPEPGTWPDAACVLCGRAAVGFYGKVDVPLAESDLYRNTTPRGHLGMALCWPCLCSFYALPYGCRLTGGPSIALHSWDERFMARTVSRRVERNRQLIALGRPGSRTILAKKEVVALQALRHHEDRLTAGVDLIVFSNNNRGQTLEIQSMDQPLAEWLRRSVRQPSRRRGFPALLRAHSTADHPGIVGLARNAFRSPELIAGAGARYLAGQLHRAVIGADAADLAELCFSLVTEVMRMNQNEIDQIKAVGARVAAWLAAENSAGKLREFNATLKDPKRMRHWLMRRNIDSLLSPVAGVDGPLITDDQFRLLFDPEVEQAWFHRQLLVVSVVHQLHERGFAPDDRAEVAADLAAEEEDNPDDIAYLKGEES
ncbi:hypothetical protein GCM10010116_40610 [Microbispora rosea subsp. aerata]|nr:hypothetical protein [Microbispora rosea]GGO20261.1 hypothetical protein GCM10010116_40610 [Microbispora rosea subsp. aerata]GIH57202.1 hypothetical protein Mro02_41160 [Microbispora rosea subsp. aerata]GLJ84728.1 hypothetical protein GCM10017588_34560 [Microbispora rosea subsp. aerata]